MTELGKLTRLTLPAQIMQQIAACIRDGVWTVGEKIPGELELMEQFGVSRNTVREALQALAFAGLLQSRPGDGTYILSGDQFDAALQKRLRQACLSEVLETRLVLETDIARLAARRIGDSERQELAEALALQQADLPEAAFIKADSAFHLCLARLCHNELLYDLYRSLLGFVEDLVGEYLSSSGQDRQLREHQALAEAVIGGRPEEADRRVRELVAMEQRLLLELNPSINKEESPCF